MKNSFLIQMLLAFSLMYLAVDDAHAIQTDEATESLQASKTTDEIQSTNRVRRALIVTSLPGDEAHLKQFKESVSSIRSSLVEKFGFDESNVRIQFGRNEEDPAAKEWETHGRATKEDLLEEASQLVANTTDSDTTWVFLIGHTYFDGSTVFFNVPDVDIQHQEFASSFEKLKGSSTFFICTPVSGYFIKGLSKSNRVVITATEADWETNGSIFHIHLAKTLESILPTQDFDFDKDGKVTLVDVYIKTARDVVDAYLNAEFPLYPTEHPNFDDNGDGRGSELQIDYLTPEQGGQMGVKRRKKNHKDGAFARQNALHFKLDDNPK